MPSPFPCIPPIPANVARAAQAVFNPDNFYLVIGDQVGFVFAAEDVADFEKLYLYDPQPSIRLPLLALITLFQFIEDIPDASAVEAIRTRIDWQYALHLPIDYPNLECATLSDFRERLLTQEIGRIVFKRILDRIAELELKNRIEWRCIDGMCVVTAVHTQSEMHLVLETMRRALESIAACWPEWLQSISLSHWYSRYDRSTLTLRLPRSSESRKTLTQSVIADGFHLLNALAEPNAPSEAKKMKEVQTLEMVWQQRTPKQLDLTIH